MASPKTDAQRNAAHVWIRQVAQVLNDAGIDKRVVIHKMATRGLDVRWTEESFKADVYRPIFAAVSAKSSTEEASTIDHGIVVEGITKWIGQEFGVVLPPFPSRYTQGEEQ
jgi:hypothetical protein